MYWRPDPSGMPNPSLKMGTSLPRVPPPEARTRPERRCAVLIPAARAGSAACSQSLTRSARNPAPGGADSSVSCPWVSPYQPMAEPHSSVAGGLSSPASPVASALVPRTRLFLISALRAAVQRRSAIPGAGEVDDGRDVGEGVRVEPAVHRIGIPSRHGVIRPAAAPDAASTPGAGASLPAAAGRRASRST